MVTREQIELGQKLGLDVRAEPEAVAIERIREVVEAALSGRRSEPATLKQIEFARTLGIVCADGDSRRIVSARIDWAKKLSVAEFAAKEFQEGDLVEKESWVDVRGERRRRVDRFVISSISPDGMVYFKGGNGRCAWANYLRKVPPTAAQIEEAQNAHRFRERLDDDAT